MASMQEGRILEVRDLKVEFGSVTAVDGVSFHLDAGETLAIVGESGSGKSVTAMAIMRLVGLGSRGRISGGEILFRKPAGTVIDLVQQPEPVMRQIRGNQISMIFQEPLTSLNPVFTIGDQIAEAIMEHQQKPRKEALEHALEMLEKVRIPEARKRLHEYPHQLSGGMRQRAMIAMALACNPTILIADEPTTALDVTIQAQILGLMRTLQEELNTAVIIITHDMGVVAEVADRALVMCRSRLVEEGPVQDIFQRPQHPYTQALLRAVPRLGSMADRPRPEKFPLVGATPEAPPSAPARTPDYKVPPVLEVRELSKRFPLKGANIHAVEKVSFTLAPGETLAIVGESGCGKSTLGNIILKLFEPSSGTILLEGQDITHLSPKQMRPYRRQMQMIFQDPFASLDPRRTVGASVAEPLIVHGMAKGQALQERVAALFRQVGLEPQHQQRFPHQFSGGQRQRICIARALALNPKLVIADESVSALDVSIQAQVINLMMDLQQELGLSYLFISHDMAVVERISHRVAVMFLGQIVEIGPRQAVFGNPQHPYTRKLLAAVPIADPCQRRQRALLTGDIPSPIRAIGDEPQPVQMREVESGHFVAAA
ncbi:MAG TPA: ABC transporter ATP-binding protein [Candidatus Competibacteraceae bacterium]|nr:ABC transporter ATP-binding protein [Candidatus Competibacteraceae bacterium]